METKVRVFRWNILQTNFEKVKTELEEKLNGERGYGLCNVEFVQIGTAELLVVAIFDKTK